MVSDKKAKWVWMGRLTAVTEVDKEMHKHVNAASRAILKALRALPSKVDNSSVRRRRNAIAIKLQGALSILGEIGNTQPGWDMDDPDLMPEQMKKPPQKRPIPPMVVGGDV